MLYLFLEFLWLKLMQLIVILVDHSALRSHILYLRIFVLLLYSSLTMLDYA